MRTIKTQPDVLDNNTTRPERLEQFVGQADLRRNLSISIQAARRLGKPLDHILFCGPPGLGKTTLAGITAAEMEKRMIPVSAPVIEKPGDMASILASVDEGDIVFIDEIHRLPKPVEELLYSAMEDFRVDILVGSGEQLKTVSLSLPPFTLVGATTREGMLSQPLLDRFAVCYHLKYYSQEELTEIVLRTADKAGGCFQKADGAIIAAASRGTPRVAINLTKRVCDYQLVCRKATVLEALSSFGIDQEGLTDLDREYIRIMKEVFKGRPAGLKAIAACLNEEERTVQDAIEPFLLRKGLIARTKAGRMLSGNMEGEIDDTH